jgi:hypothetical protein
LSSDFIVRGNVLTFGYFNRTGDETEVNLPEEVDVEEGKKALLKKPMCTWQLHMTHGMYISNG